jgi:hypothetical protein
MARGSLAKEQITKRILECFSNSFVNEKEIRIPWVEENGEEVQVKVTLTCAKVNVLNPNAGGVASSTSENVTAEDTSKTNFIPELTKDEINKVNTLIEKLGL